MMMFVQLIVGLLTVVISLALLFLMATSEFHFHDLTFALYFAIFSTIAAVAFFVLLRNNDNEETNPGKEKLRR